jgi:hypothetical protein
LSRGWFVLAQKRCRLSAASSNTRTPLADTWGHQLYCTEKLIAGRHRGSLVIAVGSERSHTLGEMKPTRFSRTTTNRHQLLLITHRGPTNDRSIHDVHSTSGPALPQTHTHKCPFEWFVVYSVMVIRSSGRRHRARRQNGPRSQQLQHRQPIHSFFRASSRSNIIRRQASAFYLRLGQEIHRLTVSHEFLRANCGPKRPPLKNIFTQLSLLFWELSVVRQVGISRRPSVKHSTIGPTTLEIARNFN